MTAQVDEQPMASATDDAEAKVKEEVVELNRKFYMWVSSSWEMCPHFCWEGAAQEYIIQVNRILDSASSGGSTRTRESAQMISASPAAKLRSEPASRPLLPSAPVIAPPSLPTHVPALSPTSSAPMPTPSTSPLVPSTSAAPSRSRKRGAQGEHPDDPHAQAPSRFSFAPTSTTKPKPTASPVTVSKPVTTDAAAHPVPAPPLFSSFGSSKPASSAAASSSPTFGGMSSGPAISKPFGSSTTAPLFGNPSTSSAPLFGTGARASSAASQPSSAPSFSFGVPASGAAAEPKSPTLPLFSSMSASGPSGASSAAAAGGFSTGFSFSQPGASSAPSFSFGMSASGDAAAPASSAGFSFGPAAAGASSSSGLGTPTFTFGSSINAAGPADNGSGAAADADEEPQEKAEKVDIKGDDKTDITFSGKASFRSKGDAGWGDPIVGLLTLRKDKASGRHWLQVNSETKGSIFVYASIPAAAKFRIQDGKPSINIIVSVFRYPPGQEPKKKREDGKTELDEREENTTTTKSVMIKTKTSDLQPLVDALKGFGCHQL
eukprot:jgi/Ulvmu1/11485/UM077_0034.1